MITIFYEQEKTQNLCCPHVILDADALMESHQKIIMKQQQKKQQQEQRSIKTGTGVDKAAGP